MKVKLLLKGIPGGDSTTKVSNKYVEGELLFYNAIDKKIIEHSDLFEDCNVALYIELIDKKFVILRTNKSKITMINTDSVVQAELL